MSMSPQGRGGPPRRHDQAPAATRLNREQVSQLLARDGYMRVNDEGRKLGDALQGGGVTTSQVRNILDSFQRINELWEKDGPDERGRKLAKLGPNLTYLAARDTNSHRKAVLLGLAETLGSGVDEVLQATDESGERRRRFRALIDLVEAITAYHRLKARS